MTERVSMREVVKAMDDFALSEEIRRTEEIVLRLSSTSLGTDGEMQLLTAQCHLMAVRSERTLRECREKLGHVRRTAHAPLPRNVISLSAWKSRRK